MQFITINREVLGAQTDQDGNYTGKHFQFHTGEQLRVEEQNGRFFIIGTPVGKVSIWLEKKDYKA